MSSGCRQSTRQRVGYVLGTAALFAIISAACGHNDPTGPSQVSSAQKPLSTPVGRPQVVPPLGKPDGRPPFGLPPGPPPWNNNANNDHEHASLQSPTTTTIAFVTRSSGAKQSVTLYSLVLIGAVAGFMHTIRGGRRRK